MPSLAFSWDQDQVGAIKLMISPAGPILKAVKMAGGDGIRALRVKSSKSIREARRIKVRAVNKALPTFFPTGRTLASLEWKMKASGKAIPLSAFPFREIKAKIIGRKGRKERVGGGVSVALKPGGVRTFVPGAFKVKLKSGHVGIALRTGAKVGAKGGRNPFRLTFGPTIAALMGNRGLIPEAHRHAGVVFGASFARLLPIELAKIKR